MARQLTFVVAGIIGVLVVIEAAANAVWYVGHGTIFYARTAEPEPVSPAVAATPDVRMKLHPYLGFVRIPHLSFTELQSAAVVEQLSAPYGDTGWSDVSTNNFGFFANRDYPVKDEDAYIVGVFGGSLAARLTIQAGQYLADKLAALPALHGKEVLVLNFASGSYKQPQQLLALGYFQSIGQRFDLILNVDGFNEAALGRYNASQGVYPSFPSVFIMRQLAVVAAPESAPDALPDVARRIELRNELNALRRDRANAITATRYFFQGYRVNRIARQIAELDRRISEAAAGQADRHVFLSPDPARQTDTAEQHIIANWVRSSRAMAHLAEQQGALYIHVLQPNQYFGSRNMEPDEIEVARDPDSAYPADLAAIYPALRARGTESVGRSGVFIDATAVFDEEASPVYVDTCCHVNMLGNRLLADMIVSRVDGLLTDGQD